MILHANSLLHVSELRIFLIFFSFFPTQFQSSGRSLSRHLQVLVVAQSSLGFHPVNMRPYAFAYVSSNIFNYFSLLYTALMFNLQFIWCDFMVTPVSFRYKTPLTKKVGDIDGVRGYEGGTRAWTELKKVRMEGGRRNSKSTVWPVHSNQRETLTEDHLQRQNHYRVLCTKCYKWILSFLIQYKPYFPYCFAEFATSSLIFA